MKYESEIGKGFHRWSEGVYTHGQELALSNFEDLFILNSGSYRSGKTEILCRGGIRHILTFPNAKLGIFRAHLASLKKSTLLTFLQLIHPSWVKDWSNTDLVMTLVNESKVSFIGADFPDRLGSIELTMALVDEASEVSEEALTMIQGRLSGHLEKPPNYDELPDNLKEYIDNTLSIRQTWLACNPKSENHYLYKKFIKDVKPGHRIYTSNSIANLNLPENYLIQNLAAYVVEGKDLNWIKEQIRKIRNGEENPDGLHLKEYLTPLGQRNLLGLWVALEGAIYALDESRHLLEEIPGHWQPTDQHYIGVDFGFHNPRIIVLRKCWVDFGSSTKSSYAAIDYWLSTDSTGEDLGDGLEEMMDKYEVEKIILPHDRPDMFKNLRNRFGASYLKKAKTSVLPGILTVSNFLNSGRFVFLKTDPNPDSPNSHLKCWEESTGYEWKKDKENRFLDEPVKLNDHFPDAYRYAIHTLEYKGQGDDLED